jgi:hypothetical protein
MDSGESSPRQILDPVDRTSEILSGLIGTIAFTGSFSIATVGPAEVRSMLIGAVGCNLAWGIMDGVIYLMDSLAAKGSGLRALRAVRAAGSREEGQRAVASALPESVAAVLQPEDLEPIRERVVQMPEPSARLRLGKDDWLGAVSVCLLVVCCTFPVVIPFLFMHDGRHALRTSHGIAIVMLFFTGYMEGRNLGHRPWAMGFAMVLLGSTLAGLTIALGG